MTFETMTVAGEGITLSQLVWRKFRKPMEGYAEQVLAINPGLATSDPYLPVGAVVRFPVIMTTAIKRPVISLWD